MSHQSRTENLRAAYLDTLEADDSLLYLSWVDDCAESEQGEQHQRDLQADQLEADQEIAEEAYQAKEEALYHAYYAAKEGR